MALNYQTVREQVKKLGENAVLREKHLIALRRQAGELLESHAHELEALRHKVELVARNYDPTLRCAAPVSARLRPPEPLNACFPLPSLASQVTLLAADGSQIAPDRHAAVEFYLINVGAIHMRPGSPEPPVFSVESQLFYGEDLYTRTGTITEEGLALQRDLKERLMLPDLARGLHGPVISFTDGPMELWGAKDSEGASEFQKSLEAYKQVLAELCALNVVTAGYVDKPAANLVVRLLELAMLPADALPEIKQLFPLRGVTDRDLFNRLLAPGDRSAVFVIQSKSAINYKDDLELHFFYLNVGREGKPSLARVEIPAWVAGDDGMLNNLHEALVNQCRLMGTRPYPYRLIRAHE
jgi:hypothetical protein